MKTSDNPLPGLGARQRGFTLLEVLVSLIIISIGLLGIAKIHALAYASTSTAASRSLVALQVSGLASSMHADRGYWATGLQTTLITISGPTVQDGALGTPANCIASAGPACTPDIMAAYDLQTYAAQLSQLLPNSNPTTTITCPAPTPVTCTIVVTWTEKTVSVNQQGQNATTATFSPSYMLYVEP
jgi:type IV pilus assembly protein PilV